MANGDFAWLQLQLAYMAGRSSVAELDNDQNLAGQCVNEAYLDCYMNPGGRRPGWAQQMFGIQLGTPLTFTVAVTQGQQAVVSSSGPLPVNRTGSTCQIGGGYYTWTGALDGSNNPLMLEPLQEATGSYTLTMWHNSFPLTVNVIEVEDAPVVLGWGILAPMASRAEDFRWRQIVYGDFYPKPGAGAFFPTGAWPGGINYPQGNPIFYRIENGPLSGGAAIAALFVVEPMPLLLTTIQFKGWICPTELSAGTDRPIMPADLSTRVLLPLCRERWAMTYKKYTGNNLNGLIEDAKRARAILELTHFGQRNKPVRMPLRNV